jgi:hypothetical protein
MGVRVGGEGTDWSSRIASCRGQGGGYWTGMVSTGAEGTTPVSASEKNRSR